MHLGYKLATEAFGPKELIRQAAMAERAGFDYVEMSEHYHPWPNGQGHSTFTWNLASLPDPSANWSRANSGRASAPRAPLTPASPRARLAQVSRRMPSRKPRLSAGVSASVLIAFMTSR